MPVTDCGCTMCTSLREQRHAIGIAMTTARAGESAMVFTGDGALPDIDGLSSSGTDVVDHTALRVGDEVEVVAGMRPGNDPTGVGVRGIVENTIYDGTHVSLIPKPGEKLVGTQSSILIRHEGGRYRIISRKTGNDPEPYTPRVGDVMTRDSGSHTVIHAINGDRFSGHWINTIKGAVSMWLKSHTPWADQRLADYEYTGTHYDSKSAAARAHGIDYDEPEPEVLTWKDLKVGDPVRVHEFDRHDPNVFEYWEDKRPFVVSRIDGGECGYCVYAEGEDRRHSFANDTTFTRA